MNVEELVNGKKSLGVESPPDSLLSPPSNQDTNVHSDPSQSSQTPPDNAQELDYCLCDRKSCEEGEIMIQCDFCEQWFHLPCVNLSPRLIADIETYVCSACTNEQRKIICNINFCTKSAFENGIVKKIHSGDILTRDYFEKNKFETPILIEDKSTLGFTMPSSDEIDLSKIENIVGGDYSIDVIDVERQEVYQMSITELNSYFKTEPREKIYNLISFEISKTKLTENITAPKIVEELSWVSNGVWSNDEQDSITASKPNHIIKPEVQKYCLISAGRSYTDFHIDFGGSSVWYHVVKGDKIFYLIEPSDENLRIYEEWNMQKNQSEIFLGDKIQNCYQFELKAGNTILLPSGWIHAVYTPSDSLVFGGNFLHSHSISLQLKIYEMEIRLNTPEKYRFPAFETLQWYAAKYFTQKLKDQNSKKECIDLKLHKNLKYLNNMLKKWITSKDYYETHDYEIPKKINCDKLVKIMNKELNKSELLLKSHIMHKKKMSTEKPQKEVLNYTNITDGIKVDADDLTESAPIKLKIKLKPLETSEQPVNQEDGGDIIDGDYVYPSLGETNAEQANCEQKSARKRKIKPFAAHYLAPKSESLTNQDDEDQDEDYFNDEEEADDNDEDFKLKVKNNLKLSNKLKKKQLKKEKLASEDKDQNDKKTTGLTPSAIGTKQKNKKGQATTKQRLGKLLKLNRIINI